MKNFGNGCKTEDNDAVCIEMMRSEGLLDKFMEMSRKAGEKDCVMMYTSVKTDECWLIRELRSVPGDTGFLIDIWPREMLFHPTVQRFLKSVEECHLITASTPIFPLGQHIPNKERN